MQIKLYSGFEKKQNSTKLPAAGTTTLTLTGYLKEDCSVINPTVRINRLANDASPSIYTYALIDDFDRYYFIDNWTWKKPFWEATMHVDVLASHKTAIGNQIMHVLRADTEVFNGYISDSLYPATNEFVINHQVLTNSDFVATVSSGCYVVGIISKGDSSSVGAICYYAMDSSEFAALNNALFSDSNLYTMGITDSLGNMLVTDMSKEVLKTMYNPYQYIASCMWFPFAKSKFTYSTQVGINIGWWTYSSLSGSRVYAQQISLLNCEHTTVPAHPQSYRGEYLNYAPYTRISLYGRFGTIPLDPSITQAGWRINISYYIDIITGQARAFITTWDDTEVNPSVHVMADRIFSLGVPIQIAQVGVDYLGTTLAAVDSVAGTVSAASRLDVGGAVSAAAHGIYNTLQCSMPQVATGGSNGSFLSPFTLTHIQFQHYTITSEDIEHQGRPVCSARTLGDMDGYVLCQDGDFDIDCLDEERTMIRDFLTSGYFVE